MTPATFRTPITYPICDCCGQSIVTRETVTVVADVADTEARTEHCDVSIDVCLVCAATPGYVILHEDGVTFTIIREVGPIDWD